MGRDTKLKHKMRAVFAVNVECNNPQEFCEVMEKVRNLLKEDNRVYEINVLPNK